MRAGPGISTLVLFWLCVCTSSSVTRDEAVTAGHNGTSEEQCDAPDDFVLDVRTLDTNGPHCGAEVYLSPTDTVPGFHVMCLKRSKDTLDVTVFRDGRNSSITFQVASGDYHSLVHELEHRLGLEQLPPQASPPAKFPWAMFTPDGLHTIQGINDLSISPLLFIFKGGTFIWPGVKLGFRQMYTGLEGIGTIEMETISMKPLVLAMRDFLTPEECQHIRERSEPNMAPSPVSKMDHDKGKDDTTWRTSTTYFLETRGDPKMRKLDKRVAQITRVPESHQEAVQVIRYEQGQKYDAHHDYFNPMLYQTSDHVLRMTDHGRRNRMVTVFWYLSDVEEGGETVFPRFGGNAGRVSFTDCNQGLRVKPERGKVAMFYSLRPDGQFDDFSLHGACPVKKGTKWAANKWVWNRPGF